MHGLTGRDGEDLLVSSVVDFGTDGDGIRGNRIRIRKERDGNSAEHER
jgi:hypothetical protein